MLVKLKYLSQILNYSSSSSSIVLKESNILITKDGTVGKVFLLTSENLEYLKSRYSSYLVLKPSSFCPPSYLYYYFLSPHFSSWYSAIKKSFATINHLNISDLKEFPILFSSLPIQQQKLIDFLNQKYHLIQELLQKIDLLLKTLEEYQEALLYDTLVHQKTPTTIIKLKYLSTLKGRIGWQALTTQEYQQHGAYLVTGVNIQQGVIDWSSCHHVSKERYEMDSNIQLQEQDLIITKDGTIGKVAIIQNLPSIATLNSGLMLIRKKSSVFYSEKYLYYLLSSFYFHDWYRLTLKPNSTILHLYQKDFLNFPVLLSPLNVQQELCTFLDHKMNILKNLQSHYQSLKAHLEEYQQSLLYETFQHLS